MFAKNLFESLWMFLFAFVERLILAWENSTWKNFVKMGRIRGKIGGGATR
ncbi:MAG: hypothetical protein LBT09_07660 [Planctomycetaceae bacterium]|jgi:hypothetical protein|nr:hypothetical protein [Planctomycetaceae bacterium]